MTGVRIGQIEYLNCLPIFSEFISRHGAEAIAARGVPSVLNRMLAAGEIDLCPSSSIEYAKGEGSYLLLPDLSISSVGSVRSVLLFTRRPLASLSHGEVGLTVDSDTSVALLTILLRRFYGLQNSFRRLSVCSLDEMNHDAVLLIGDTALREAGRAKGWLVHDLGELWWEFTGLPFVFALWIVRQEVCLRQSEEVRLLARWFREAKESAYRSYDDIARSAPESGLSAEQLVSYWQTISYDLSSCHLQGLELFFKLAAEEGLIPCQPPLTFFSPA